MAQIIQELFRENVVRGRGLLSLSIIQAQAASPSFTHTYASLVAVINSKFPHIGELILTRLIIRFRRGFQRNNKDVCSSSTCFIAHLVNQKVANESLALEILALLLHSATVHSIQVAVSFLKECGQKLSQVSPHGLTDILDLLKSILPADLEKHVKYMIEEIFQMLRFTDNSTSVDGVDLVDENHQFTHFLSIYDETLDSQHLLNIFLLEDDKDKSSDEEEGGSKSFLYNDASSMLLKFGDYFIPAESVDMLYSSMLDYDDLNNLDKAFSVGNDSRWRKYLQRKLKSSICTAWRNCFQFRGWSSHLLAVDSKKICEDITACSKNINHNWKNGKHNSTKVHLQEAKNKGEVQIFVLMNIKRIAVWMQEAKSKIMILTRDTLKNENEIDLFENIEQMFSMALNDEFLFGGFENGHIKIWNLETAKEVGEFHNHLASGDVSHMTYCNGILITLSDAPNSENYVLTIRHFSQQLEVVKILEETLKFHPFPELTDFDGQFVFIVSFGSQELDILIWDVHQRWLVVKISGRANDSLKSIKSSNGLLFVVLTKHICINQSKSGTCLREISLSAKSICSNSEFLVTSNNQNQIHIWSLSALCQESIHEIDCLVSTISPSITKLLNLVCDCFQIVAYQVIFQSGKQPELLIYDFWKEVGQSNHSS